MTTSGKEIYDNPATSDIELKILTISSGEHVIWKQTVMADEKLFNQLFELVFSDNQPLAWRACWIVDGASELNPALMNDKLPRIITSFISTQNESLKRHFARILCRFPIPEEYQGVVVNRCFDLLVPVEPAAVRVNAMQLLFNISGQIPDLKNELISVIEGLIDEGGSVGFLNRSVKLLRRLRS